MKLYQPIENLFAQLQEVLEELTPGNYSMPSQTLSGATIGQHTRHIIELFVQLNKGYEKGSVNYGQRQRDMRLETDRSFAIQTLRDLLASFKKPDKNLELVSDLSIDSSDALIISTSYFRELVYNIEHSIHHMALIRVGVQELTDMQLPMSFGVASSTIRHRQKACAQ